MLAEYGNVLYIFVCVYKNYKPVLHMNSTRLTSVVYYDSNSFSCEGLLTVRMVRPPQTAEVYLLDIPRIIFKNKVRERECLG